MYSNEQSRINATISYFFLGPIFLIAKTGTPLADPYVRSHAKKSSLIILVTLLAYIAYHFGVKPFTNISILGFYLQSVLTTSIVTVSIFFLIRGAYHAYHGESGAEIDSISVFHSLNLSEGPIEGSSIESEVVKIRILASLLPFFGIFIASRSAHPLIEIGKKVGSLLTFLIVISIILTDGISLMTTIFTIVYVLIFTIESVFLFTENTFQFAHWFDKIPSYRNLEAHFFSILKYTKEFLRVAFGSEHAITYREILEQENNRANVSDDGYDDYFMPVWLLAIPGINLIAIPSLFRARWKAYRFLIIQGCILTILTGGIISYNSVNTPYLLLLLFPIFHLIAYSKEYIATSSPIIGTLARLLGLGTSLKQEVQKLHDQKIEVRYTYEEK